MATINPIELQKALKGIEYPASREALVDCAKHNRAPEELVQTLSHLDRERFDGPNHVEQAVFSGH